MSGIAHREQQRGEPVDDGAANAELYRRAAMFRPRHRGSLIRNAIQDVHWLADRPGAVYRVRREHGDELVLVDPVARGVSSISEADLSGLVIQRDPRFRGFGPAIGRYTLFSHESNLWLADRETAERIQLSTDGIPDFPYGVARDPPANPAGWSNAPVLWSPDGRYGLTQRIDYRGVRSLPLVEAAPPGGGLPRVHELRDAWPGDEHIPWVDLLIVDVTTGAMLSTSNPRVPVTHSSPLLRQDTWWDPSGEAVYLLHSTRDWLTLTLYRIEAATGHTVALVSETGERRVRPSQQFHQKPNVSVLTRTNEVLWFSERDGWGHLYLYDAATGRCIRQVTSGASVIQELLHVDETSRTVLALVSGLVEADPYRRSLCLIDIDGGGMERVSDDDEDHGALLTPIAGSQPGFIDIASTVSDPPLATFRDWSGAILVELERADLSGLEAEGWRRPQRVSGLGADGTTRIYGTLFLPPDFDPGKSYPVLDHLYPGPQTCRSMPYFDADEIEPFVALGMVGVTIDGRGTPGRSRAFYDASWENLEAGSGLDDHVALVRELAWTRPWMDVERVGVYGHSAGGFAALRAMELFPDFYSVGICSAGRYDGRMVMAMILEAYDHPSDADAWARASAVDHAGDITGKLLLVHGEMDRAVIIQHAYRVIDRLIAANRDFELLVVPGDDHVFSRHEAYVERRQWDFYVRHLFGKERPKGFFIQTDAPDEGLADPGS